MLPLLAMKYEILLIIASVTAIMAIMATAKLGMLTYEVLTERHYTLKDKLGYFASLFVMILGISGLGGVAKNTWESIQKTNATRQMHEEKINKAVEESNAKLKSTSEEYEWKRLE